MEIAISGLSYNGQIRRLRELAEAALTYFDIGNARLSLLNSGADTLFQVMAQRRIASDEDSLNVHIEKGRYTLRLYGDEVSTESILSEMRWLLALRRDTELVVPEPVATRTGSLLIQVEIEDIPETPRCGLFRWVEGRFSESLLNVSRMERAGMFMARLHQHAENYMLPSDFTRPRWDWQELIKPELTEIAGDLGLSAREAATFTTLFEQMEEMFAQLTTNKAHYGLIHSDFQPSNYLFYKDEVRAIDFEKCQFGYYLYDMAVALYSLCGRASEEILREAFFSGYTQIRVLPEQHEKRLSLFTAIYILEPLLRNMWSHSVQARTVLIHELKLVAEQVRAYLAL
ncbi:phosphotransferase enzyme family protein [Ktedonospora formicarum]|uniref:Aminoglycoside phosphotransferase n=1 Tax=Ktedonospora formicarum TaxID=2778364 RepID=A0A8J3I3W0_9CHLR|nr:phosphotransferase [Ktedonospora formicarum]GHO46380.1 aminoglycoside phosphotransferase [Ktedonospora formicarum]